MKVKAGVKYEFQPAGWDVFDPRTDLEPGTVVEVFKPYGCPPPNTMGHAHVRSPETGEFWGLVSTASLVPLGRKAKEEAA